MIRSSRTLSTRVRPHKLGPRDAGQIMTLEEYESCYEKPGWVAEIIDGVVQVSPSPRIVHNRWEAAVHEHLLHSSADHPTVINFVSSDNDVVIPGRPGPTRPRPDISAYRDFPKLSEIDDDLDWADFCPILVVEVVSRRRLMKDVRRNRQLYWLAGGIVEYWILNPRKNAREPVLIVLSRHAEQPDRVETVVPFGETYVSKLTPGLRINLKALLEQNK